MSDELFPDAGRPPRVPVMLHVGDCRQVLTTFDDESIDAIVTDPPYGLEFLGNAWDIVNFRTWVPEWAGECLRVLKPGGHMVAFGGTRTFHRLACGIEDSGFEIRDTLSWLYGTGFPKSMNVSKAIDKAAGVEREAVGRYRSPQWADRGYDYDATGATERHADPSDRAVPVFSTPDWEGRVITAPVTEHAVRWDGWGTALKPGWEPIVLARKPIRDTIVVNVVEHGTGALNIDATRLGATDPLGRWPANVILTHADACVHVNDVWACVPNCPVRTLDDRGAERGDGGPSRYFYCSRASTAERNAGLPDARNTHPTVKPVDVMRWLIRLITPPDGVVLDPFCGSGSTGIAAVLERHAFIGIDSADDYIPIAAHRIDHHRGDVNVSYYMGS